MDKEDRDEVYDVVSVLDDAYNELNNGGSLEDIEEEVSDLKEYEGEFDGGVGDRIDQIAEISGSVHRFLTKYEAEGEENITISEVLGPLEEYDVEVSYNGNEDVAVEGDPGLSLAANTIGENGLRHGKEDETYQMWAKVIENSEAYEVEVWDNGSGLPEDIESEEIFDKGVGENTGKGLYLANEIVEFFNGSIEVSEELEEREGGFGLRMELMKPSN